MMIMDYIITRRIDPKDTLETRAMRGPYCVTHHKLIRACFKFTIKPAYSKNQVLRKRKHDTAKLALGFFAVGQFAVRKKNLSKHNLT